MKNDFSLKFVRLCGGSANGVISEMVYEIHKQGPGKDGGRVGKLVLMPSGLYENSDRKVVAAYMPDNISAMAADS